MCRDLVNAVEKLLPQLERMTQGGKVNANVAQKPVEGEPFISRIYIRKDIVTHLASLRNVKEEIKQFHFKRDRIMERMVLDLQGEEADHHKQVFNNIEAVIAREQRIEQQAKEEFEALQELVKGGSRPSERMSQPLFRPAWGPRRSRRSPTSNSKSSTARNNLKRRSRSSLTH